MHHAQNAAAVLAAGHPISVTVTSDSMCPTLPVGTVVRVQPGRARVGEVALILDGAIREEGSAPTGERLILHRVLGRLRLPRARYVVHVGDASGAPPYLCREEDLLGVAELPPTQTQRPLRLLCLTLAAVRIGARRARSRFTRDRGDRTPSSSSAGSSG